jgi:hypothetical protein
MEMPFLGPPMEQLFNLAMEMAIMARVIMTTRRQQTLGEEMPVQAPRM